MTGKSILIVDDEAPIREMIAVALEMAGYECLEADNSKDAHALIVDRKPDLILLDWMLPGTSGLELARRLKRDELTDAIPIIMLTAKGDEDNKVQGLETGADDYITKPFSPRELVARVGAVLRRVRPALAGETLTFADVEMDTVGHKVRRGGQVIPLGPTEFRLLKHFLEHPGWVFSRERLLDSVWGQDSDIELRTVDVHIRRLRKAINVDGRHDIIRTVRSAGYALDTDGLN